MAIKNKTIRKKLFSLVTHILLITLGISQLTASILLFTLSHETFRDGEVRIEENLIDKGSVLVANNSISLQRMVEDNAFFGINELLSSTLQRDRDVIYGIYMDNKRQPWVEVTPDKSDGISKTLTAANDSVSRWADSIDQVSYKRIKRSDSVIIEFAAPVYVVGQKMGTVRYGISTARMQQLIGSLRQNFYRQIFRYTIILLIISAFLLFYVLRIATRQASAITGPLSSLTSVAQAISDGNYSVSAKIEADDEIEVLATSFEGMRQTIKKYTDNLEQLVEERTCQLNNSYKEQLIQANKLVTLGTLVAGVAHEVNNPNNSILLSAGALEEMWPMLSDVIKEYSEQCGDFSVGGMSPEEFQEEMPLIISRLINNSRRIKNIVEDLKNYSKKDYTKPEEEVAINEVVKSSVEMIEKEIDKHTSHFNLCLAPDLPQVKGYFQRLEQVIVNLVINACQALESKDKAVAVSTCFDQENKSVVVTVRDQGVGMDEETKQKILQSFFTTKHHQGGTGLGLAVTSRIVKDHGGALEFDSKPSEGTVVKVVLPQNK